MQFTHIAPVEFVPAVFGYKAADRVAGVQLARIADQQTEKGKKPKKNQFIHLCANAKPFAVAQHFRTQPEADAERVDSLLSGLQHALVLHNIMGVVLALLHVRQMHPTYLNGKKM